MDGKQLRESLGIAKTSRSNSKEPASQVTSVTSLTSVTSVTSVKQAENSVLVHEFIKLSELKRSQINKAVIEGVSDRELLLLALETISIMIDDNLFFYRSNKDKLLARR